MATDKQNEGKFSPMDENKENSPDGGLGLESILHSTRCGGGLSELVNLCQAEKLTVAC